MITAYAREVNRIVIKLSFYSETTRYLALERRILIDLFTMITISQHLHLINQRSGLLKLFYMPEITNQTGYLCFSIKSTLLVKMIVLNPHNFQIWSVN